MIGGGSFDWDGDRLVVGTASDTNVNGQFAGAARVWASDLTVDYVRFNSEYTT